MKECPKCHDIQLDYVNYCRKCGVKMESPKKCECGNDIYDHYPFCPKCGKEVANV